MSSYESIDVPKFCMVFPLKSKGMTSRWPLVHTWLTRSVSVLDFFTLSQLRLLSVAVF